MGSHAGFCVWAHGRRRMHLVIVSYAPQMLHDQGLQLQQLQQQLPNVDCLPSLGIADIAIQGTGYAQRRCGVSGKAAAPHTCLSPTCSPLSLLASLAPRTPPSLPFRLTRSCKQECEPRPGFGAVWRTDAPLVHLCGMLACAHMVACCCACMADTLPW